jgi:TIR domain
MTPPKLVQLKCPECAATHWTIDSDYRGIDGIYIDYSERDYECPGCGYSKEGYSVLQKSPPEFFLQPHPMYPMRQKDFDYWADILTSHVPDHLIIEDLGKEFRPNTQVFLTKLRNMWKFWEYKARRRAIVLRVDIEDWLEKRFPKRQIDSPGAKTLEPIHPITRDPDSVNIFVSYSHIPDDSYIVFKLVNYLERRLKKLTEERRPAVSISCIRKVSVGAGWQDEVDEKYFLSAKYVLLMITPDYLASDYCRRQMNRAEERERMGSVKVIPVILRQVKWSSPALWELLPSKGLPVTNWPNREEAFADIAEGILRAIPAEVQKTWVDPSPPEEELL